MEPRVKGFMAQGGCSLNGAGLFGFEVMHFSIGSARKYSSVNEVWADPFWQPADGPLCLGLKSVALNRPNRELRAHHGYYRGLNN